MRSLFCQFWWTHHFWRTRFDIGRSLLRNWLSISLPHVIVWLLWWTRSVLPNKGRLLSCRFVTEGWILGRIRRLGVLSCCIRTPYITVSVWLVHISIAQLGWSSIGKRLAYWLRIAVLFVHLILLWRLIHSFLCFLRRWSHLLLLILLPDWRRLLLRSVYVSVVLDGVLDLSKQFCVLWRLNSRLRNLVLISEGGVRGHTHERREIRRGLINANGLIYVLARWRSTRLGHFNLLGWTFNEILILDCGLSIVCVWRDIFRFGLSDCERRLVRIWSNFKQIQKTLLVLERTTVRIFVLRMTVGSSSIWRHLTWPLLLMNVKIGSATVWLFVLRRLILIWVSNCLSLSLHLISRATLEERVLLLILRLDNTFSGNMNFFFTVRKALLNLLNHALESLQRLTQRIWSLLHDRVYICRLGCITFGRYIAESLIGEARLGCSCCWHAIPFNLWSRNLLNFSLDHHRIKTVVTLLVAKVVEVEFAGREGTTLVLHSRLMSLPVATIDCMIIDLLLLRETVILTFLLFSRLSGSASRSFHII